MLVFIGVLVGILLGDVCLVGVEVFVVLVDLSFFSNVVVLCILNL